MPADLAQPYLTPAAGLQTLALDLGLTTSKRPLHLSERRPSSPHMALATGGLHLGVLAGTACPLPRAHPPQEAEPGLWGSHTISPSEPGPCPESPQAAPTALTDSPGLHPPQAAPEAWAIIGATEPVATHDARPSLLSPHELTRDLPHQVSGPGPHPHWPPALPGPLPASLPLAWPSGGT